MIRTLRTFNTLHHKANNISKQKFQYSNVFYFQLQMPVGEINQSFQNEIMCLEQYKHKRNVDNFILKEMPFYSSLQYQI